MEFFKKNIFQKIAYELSDLKYQKKERLGDIIKKYELDIANIKFISVGANDGIKHDPIAPFLKKYDWEGVFIEPIPEYFSLLKENYKKSRKIILEQAAIGSEESQKNIYLINPKAPWITIFFGKRLASFDRKIIESHSWYVPMLRKNIINLEVAVIPLRTIIEKYEYWDVDLITIDVEGYELEVITSLDFTKIKPKIIFFETKHLTINGYEKIVNLLETEGYKIFALGRDSYAIS
ncbi:FkbM family methyltransferase [Halomonas sp. SpR8]|uniref:FkbM family methyltransferase n=1 Tax=Halomonas sp. SpR8 TaxID=3050463 RepID=UPI0027E59AED|nr:FkbM family methyltransferase [Halomonas sp. SpR8]MDQ7730920.1 FkbM family methyltransferase [Halomonas sp. SpR8]